MINENLKHLPQLDGVRGLAVLLVVLAHAGSMGMIGNSAGNGQVGVMLFFILSGFLMTCIYAQQPIQSRDLAIYYLRRFFRVYPVYFIVLLASWKFPLHSYPINNTNIAGHLILQDGVSILWTIPVELKYYVVFPALGTFITLFRSMSAKVIALLCLILLTSGMSGEGLKTELLPYLAFFISGSVVSVLYVNTDSGFLQNGIGNALFVIALGLFVFSLPSTVRYVFDIEPPLWNAPFSYMLSIGLLLYVIVLSPRFSMLVFGNRGIRFLGKISFSLYLIHLPILTMGAIQGVAPLLLFPLIVLIAYIFWHIIELPSQKMGKYLAGRVKPVSNSISIA